MIIFAIILLISVILLNLFIITQVSNIINFLEEELQRQIEENTDDALLVKLKEFQKMKFTASRTFKNEK